MTYYKWNNLGSLTNRDGDFLVAASLNGILENVCSPIGAILPWAKASFSTQVGLPTGWVECNGQTLSDSDSPLNGEAIPNLNGVSGAEPTFLLGSTISGETGGVGSHVHTGTTSVAETSTTAGAGGTAAPTGTHTHTFTTGTASNYPPYYTVTFIMRVK